MIGHRRANGSVGAGPRSRIGFTITETLVALGILAIALGLVAQLATWSLEERTRNALRQQVLETAANVVEAARAQPWDGLTPEWAAGQRLPKPLAEQLPGGELTVCVEPEKDHPRIRRVTVRVAWKRENGMPARPVELTALVSDRARPEKGGQP